MKQLKPEVYQLISKGYTIENIARILDESEEIIKAVHSAYLSDIIAENEDMRAASLNKQHLDKIRTIIHNYFLQQGYDISKKASRCMPDNIFENIKREMT